MKAKITDFHAKYFAHEINRSGGSGLDKLGRALFDACVDLNPHQLEAALFAMRSPISKGVILADEVGLGKTIEAGLVLCQLWAEKKRQLLVITPASLRKQWALELSDKFNLPAIVLDAKTYKMQLAKGVSNPFRDKQIIVCSMNFVAIKAEEVKQIAWDCVVIDEAHKLRNAYRDSNKTGQAVRWATEDRKTILLTATPLQNSLLELFGLSTLIDNKIFGDINVFRNQYINYGGDIEELRERLSSFCWRTLRKDVTEFVSYTERRLLTRAFTPTEQEHKLYLAVSEYLQREDCYALPAGQKHLITLIVRKVLASSPYAVAGTLETLRNRLIALREEIRKNCTPLESLVINDDFDDDLLAEILEDQEDSVLEVNADENFEPEQKKIDLSILDREIDELADYIRWANSIGVDTKTRALLKSLEIGFDRMREMGAANKAVIFTESKRSQEYIKTFLEANGYAGKVLTFNGGNSGQEATAIYTQWQQENKGTGIVSGSRAVDIRTAIIDKFKADGQILIATEAAAEGINLQFCSMLINYDLPWNPQRIEQRIGRCHRYGQKYDVIVINFINSKNEADMRVYELLEQKFNLFEGVFGSSDEVLGALESGVDFEYKVNRIVQQCRTAKEIENAFAALRAELEEQISLKMKETSQKLLDHFDEEVHNRIKVNLSDAKEKLDHIGRMFWQTTENVLDAKAVFNEQELSFDLHSPPVSEFNPGTYQLITKQKANVPGEFLYRISSKLGEYVLNKAMSLNCQTAELVFNISNHALRIVLVEQQAGKSGWLRLQHVQIDSFATEDYLLFTAIDEAGNSLDSEICEKMFHCAAELLNGNIEVPFGIEKRLQDECDCYLKATVDKNLEENNTYFNEARDQLDKWARDMELAAEKQLDDIKRQIRDFQRQSRQVPTLAEQKEILERIEKLEKDKRAMRQRMFDIDDQTEEKRKKLVESLARTMKQKVKVETLFTLRWKVK